MCLIWLAQPASMKLMCTVNYIYILFTENQGRKVMPKITTRYHLTSLWAHLNINNVSSNPTGLKFRIPFVKHLGQASLLKPTGTTFHHLQDVWSPLIHRAASCTRLA